MSSPAQMNGKILIIDDSDKIRGDVRRALAGDGFEILEAVDGLEGLEKLRARNDLTLALCDVNMPRMTGLEMLAELARSDSHVKTPILMLTTEGQPSLIRQARENGAKGWIIKPFKTELLRGAVRKIASTGG
jgi:two-component system, chemotaxis family, chemotaxis protein CheY